MKYCISALLGTATKAVAPTVLMSLAILAAVFQTFAAEPIVLSPEEGKQQGAELVQRMRSLQPEKPTTSTATLSVQRSRSKPVNTPIRFELRPVSDTEWTTLYEAPGVSTGISKMIVRHADGRTNLYQVVADGNERTLTAEETMVPFAGSDFWVVDLGLEFLSWPEQRILRKEIRRGQSCSVLQSINPNPVHGGYARVLSWVDIDTGGIINADAYDADGKLMKEFAAKSFKKVQGQWELKEIEMYDRRTRSRTTITFDLGRQR